MSALLQLNHITKQYPGVLALDDVSVSFEKGEVHALLGENGAGKSTLIKVLAGAITPNVGQIIMDGVTYPSLTPQLARKLGIGIIYQEFTLIPTLSVAENIFLGKEYRKGMMLDKKPMIEKAKKILCELGVDIDPNQPVKQLSVAYQQIVEISKALANDVRVLIMDEPTAPLTIAEVDKLFAVVRKLVASGVTIIFISHKMEELFELADRVTVLRDGTFIQTVSVKETNRAELISMMVGRPINDQYPKRESNIGEPLLCVEHLYAKDFLKDINFTVHAGEIVGLAGLIGAGRTELVRAIYGADPMQSGTISLCGKQIHKHSPASSIANGIALLPESRKEQGVILGMSIYSNILLSSIRRLSAGFIVRKDRCKELVKKHVDLLQIKTPSEQQKVVNLSGGNQQKVVIAKFLAVDPKVYIFDEPTRGIDVGAKHEIYLLMNRLVSEGKAIIMISSELPEILGMSDRILVIHEGQISGEVSRAEATQEIIMNYASGGAKA